MDWDIGPRRSGGTAGDRYAITVAFELESGAGARFRELVSINAKASVAHEPGCLRFDVLLPATPGAPDVLLYEIYRDRAAFDDHLATEHFRSFDRETQALVKSKTVTAFSVEENAKP